MKRRDFLKISALFATPFPAFSSAEEGALSYIDIPIPQTPEELYRAMLTFSLKPKVGSKFLHRMYGFQFTPRESTGKKDDYEYAEGVSKMCGTMWRSFLSICDFKPRELYVRQKPELYSWYEFDERSHFVSLTMRFGVSPDYL